MSERYRHIVVLGCGGWGTAIARLLARKGRQVSLWAAKPEEAEEILSRRENVRYLPGIPWEPSIALTSDLEVVHGADLVIVAVPTTYLREVIVRAAPLLPPLLPLVSLTKGMEYRTFLRPSQMIAESCPRHPVAILSGPSHAEEVARDLPTTVVVAARRQDLVQRLQVLFATRAFRVYTNRDLVGVELSGALKNIIAVAAGICDGLGFGSNSKAALLTRGLVEITRLGKAMGARRETFSGLTGMGDLITTCISPYGRNRSVGEWIGKGGSLKDFLARTRQVAEGINTTRAVRALSLRRRISMPITEEVYQILFRGKSPRQGVEDLMRREFKPEGS